MTPQLLQFFTAPMVAADVSPVPHSDISNGGVSDLVHAPDDPGFGFGQMMQNGVGLPTCTVVLPQTVPHPIRFGAPGAVAMLMLAGARDLEGDTVIGTDTPAAVLTDDAEKPATDLMDVLPNSGPIPVPQPIPATSVAIPPPPPPPAEYRAADVTGISADVPRPESVPLAKLMDQGGARLVNTPATKAEIETLAMPATDKLQPVLAGIQSPPTALNAGPTPSTVAVFAPPILATLPQAPQTLATLSPVPESAIAAHVPEARTEMPKSGHVTPAETVFHLRSKAGSGDSFALAVDAPAQMPDRAAPRPTMIPLEHTKDMSAPIQEAETKPLADRQVADWPVADRPVATPSGLAPDAMPLTAAHGGADPAKPSPAGNPQAGSGHLATAPAPTALPPRLSADLVNLAKTSPSGPVEILLNPAELGNLRFEIHQKADHLRVVLSVERPETMELLRRNADQLLGEFKAAGFSGAQLSFGQWDQHGSDPRPPPAPPPPLHQGWASDPAPPAISLHPLAELATPTGLNMRL